MDFRIQDVSKSSVSEFCFGAMACCVTSYNVALMVQHELTRSSFLIICVAGIVFVGWLIWFFRMYLGGRKVKVMPRKQGIVVELVNWILFAIWVLTTWITKMCHPVWVIVSWSLWVSSLLYYAFSIYRQETTK